MRQSTPDPCLFGAQCLVRNQWSSVAWPGRIFIHVQAGQYKETNSCKRASFQVLSKTNKQNYQQLTTKKQTHKNQPNKKQKPKLTNLHKVSRFRINVSLMIKLLMYSSLNLHSSLEALNTLGLIFFKKREKKKEHGFEMSGRLPALFIHVCNGIIQKHALSKNCINA